MARLKRRADVDDLRVAGPLDHDVRGLQVAVDDPLAMQGCQRGQAVADNGDGDPRLQPRLHRTGRDDHLVDVLPPPRADALLDLLEHLLGQQAAQVVAVDPFHLHDADAEAVDPVLHVQEVVLLDLGDVGGDLGDASHGLVVRPLVFVVFGREDFQGHGEREAVGPAALGEIHDALAAGAEQAEEPMVLGPALPALAEDRAIAAHQLLGAACCRVAAPGAGRLIFVECGGGHACPTYPVAGPSRAGLAHFSAVASSRTVSGRGPKNVPVPFSAAIPETHILKRFTWPRPEQSWATKASCLRHKDLRR